jgi:energy-coupling factor transporter ATP-binding protein EcfA2
VISFIFLIANTLLVFFNKELYLVLQNPKKNFAYNMHVAKELAQVLKQKGYSCVKTDEKMQNRLRFYGINSCMQNSLKELPLESKKEADVTISYKNRLLYKATVTKLNNKQSN